MKSKENYSTTQSHHCVVSIKVWMASAGAKKTTTPNEQNGLNRFFKWRWSVETRRIESGIDDRTVRVLRKASMRLQW